MPIGIARPRSNQLALASTPDIIRAMTTRKPRIAAALAKRDRLKNRLDAATVELHEALVDDLDDDFTKVELAKLMKVSRERIRLIENAVRDRRAGKSSQSG